jgi:hypothetical protein
MEIVHAKRISKNRRVISNLDVPIFRFSPNPIAAHVLKSHELKSDGQQKIVQFNFLSLLTGINGYDEEIIKAGQSACLIKIQTF